MANARTVLSFAQRKALREALGGRIIALCFGAGVDSTAMMVALKAADLRPDVITMADTGGEKPETMEHARRINDILKAWGWPLVSIVRKATKAETGYTDLYGNCLKNETLPSLAFGMKSCSLRWKVAAQDQYIKGVSKGPNRCDPHPIWVKAQREDKRILKLIGYDCGKADMRRSAGLKESDADFDYAYPLQIVRWNRHDCVRAIAQVMGTEYVPLKSACFFCPASKVWELFWLAAEHPEMLEAALHLERVALTGRHSRFNELEFGASWEELVRNAESFPSSNTTVGLGRSFAWNQWARVNGVVDEDFKVRRELRDTFLSMSEAMRGEDNALDARSGKGISQEALIRIVSREQIELDELE